MPNTRRRSAEREQYWRDAVAAWKESGQTITAFCAGRGISQATFYVKRRLYDRPAPSHPSPASPPSFTAVRVIPDPTVEIVVPGGLIVRAPAAADPDAVARLVLALRGAPC